MWNELNLGYEKLTDSALNDRLKALPTENNYQKLNLSVNNLENVPDLNRLPQFQRLQKLWLEENNIRQIDTSRVPRYVTTINLNRNAIREIPDVGKLYVQELFLSNNKIREIQPLHLSIGLTELRLCDNDIEDIPNLSYQSLYELHLSNNRISNVTAKHLPVTLSVLILNNNSITILEDMSHLTALQTLRLHKNNLTVLKGLPTSLIEVSLSDNPLEVLDQNCFTSKGLYKTIKKRPDSFYMKDKGLNDLQVSALKSPPPQVFRAGYDTVKQYFVDLPFHDDKIQNTVLPAKTINGGLLRTRLESETSQSYLGSKGSHIYSCASDANTTHDSLNISMHILEFMENKTECVKGSLIISQDNADDIDDTKWHTKLYNRICCRKVKTNHLSNIFKKLSVQDTDNMVVTKSERGPDTKQEDYGFS